MQFKDAQFLSAVEKQTVFRQWQRFLKNGLQEEDFGNALYHHLMQHASFIAHYDKQGFYATYFQEPKTIPNFFQQFDKDKEYRSFEYGDTDWISYEPYSDINISMANEFEKHKNKIYAMNKLNWKRDIEQEIKRLHAESIMLGPVEQQQNITEVTMPTNDEIVNEAIGSEEFEEEMDDDAADDFEVEEDDDEEEDDADIKAKAKEAEAKKQTSLLDKWK